MKKDLKRKYLPENSRQDVFLKMHDLKQKDISVEDYTEFDHLMIQGDFEESEEHSIARYLRWLKYEISNVVSLQPYYSLHDVMKLALKVERQIKARGTASSRYGDKSDYSKGAGFKTTSKKEYPKEESKSEGRSQWSILRLREGDALNVKVLGTLFLIVPIEILLPLLKKKVKKRKKLLMKLKTVRRI